MVDSESGNEFDSPLRTVVVVVLPYDKEVNVSLSKSVVCLKGKNLLEPSFQMTHNTYLQNYNPKLTTVGVTEINGQRIQPLETEEARHRQHPDILQRVPMVPASIQEMNKLLLDRVLDLPKLRVHPRGFWVKVG